MLKGMLDPNYSCILLSWLACTGLMTHATVPFRAGYHGHLPGIVSVYLMFSRWEWQPLACCTCAPNQGHLPAGASQTILLTFQADKPVQLKGQALTLKATQISGNADDGGLRQWSSVGPSRPSTAEPAVQVLPGTAQDIQIKVQ